MKKTASPRALTGGFTLGEMIVAVGIMTVVGLAVFAVTNIGTILYSKNTAINLAHDQARIAVSRLVKDIHGAVSIPKLGHIDSRPFESWSAPAGSWGVAGSNVTFVADGGTGPAAGVAFQVMGGPGCPSGGPFHIFNDPSSAYLIMIDSGPNVPQVGMRLVFPYFREEDEITKIAAEGNGSNHYNIWTKNGLEGQYSSKKDTYNICYYTSRVAYVVENGELRYYSSAPPPDGVTWPVVLARNLINAADRTQPATPFTQTTTQYVGVNLTAEDQHFTNRGFRAVNTLVAGSVPYYSQLCVFQ
jgi:hypothetical protein